jgi:hypothetical protein
MQIDPLNLSLDKELALVKCAKAAVAWYNPQRADSKRLAVVGRAMAWAARAKGGTLPARTLSEFLVLLNSPVTEWLGGSGGPLVEGGAVTELALDVIAETGGADAEAEIVQARVGGTRATFAARDNGDEEYRRFRRFLIEHATATVDEAQTGVLAAGLAPPDLFEEISPSCKDSIGAMDVFYPCRRCGWPMRCLDEIVQCTSKVCQSEGARFLKNRGALSAVRSMAPPDAVRAAGRLRLRHPVWRYTLQPGLVELDLAARLTRIPRVEVVLWPERDRYDLDVRVGGASWAVDVKDWSFAAKLANHFQGLDPPEKLFVVLPEWRRDHIAVLKDRCRHPNLHFCTVKQFVRTVRTLAQRTRGGREKAR